jgi:hypothetical protein
VTFNALDVLVVFVDHDCVPAEHLALVYAVCAHSLQNPNIGIAVLAAYPLACMVERKTHLFDKRTGIALFRRAVQLVTIVMVASRGVKHHELDSAVQASRAALR